MKYILITIIIWVFVAVSTFLCLLAVNGCTQVIIEPDRLKVNTFLKSTEFDTAYYDPDGIFEVSKYKGIPSDVEIVYDPLTKSFKFVAKKEK